ncbi:MAG: hypothetical protein WC523_05980 [Patescibacteria group bacterium]
MSTKTSKINPGERFTQNLRVLFAVNADFQEDINNLRAISPSMVFSNPTKEEENLRLEDLEDFNEPISQEEEYEEWLKGAEKRQQLFKVMVSKLRTKYNLSFGYQTYLEDLINNPEAIKIEYSAKYLPESLIPFKIANPNNPEEILSVLNISPETSLDEVQRYWKEIKSRAVFNNEDTGHKKPKSYPCNKLDRDLKIFNLKLEGKTSKEIQKIIRFDYPETLGCEEINIIIKRLKEKANKITRQDSQASV